MTEIPPAAAPLRRLRRIIPFALLGLVLLVVGAIGSARLFVPHGPVAPDFTLTDQHGKPFTLSDERGHAVALFFGYTHCPDVCPTTLAALAHAKRSLGGAGKSFSVVFVTVDPQRDTRAVMGRYLRLFDPSFIGLSGTSAQLASAYAAYHVYHEKLPSRSALGYLVAHTSTIDFIGADGRIRGYGDWSDNTQHLAAEMRQAIS